MPRNPKKNKNSKTIVEKFWLGLGVLMAVFIVLSTFLVVQQSKKDTTADRADASFNISPFLPGVNFKADDIYVMDDGQKVNAPTKGVWSFDVARQDNGAYPQSIKGILSNKQAVTLTGDYKNQKGLKLNIIFRFNKDDQNWWLNGVFIRRSQGNTNLILTSLSPFYADNRKNESAWESQVFSQVIGEKMALNETFKGDIIAPLYRLSGTSVTDLKEQGRMGVLVVKGADISVFPSDN